MMPVRLVGESINDEFVIRKCSEFSFEHRSDASPCFLCRCQLKMPDHGAEPFICLAAECEPEVGERRDVIPLVGDLAFVDSSHEFKRHNGVFGWISVEIWKFDNLRLHGDVGVGLNLPRQISRVIVALDRWLNVLDVLLVEARASSDWVNNRIDDGHDVCLKRILLK